MNNLNVLIKWDKALDLLGETLKLNNVTYRMLKRGRKFQATLDEFKVGKIIQSTIHCFIIRPQIFNMSDIKRNVFVLFFYP